METDSVVKAARLRKGLTLRALAEAVKERGESVDFGQLGKIERGEASPRPALRKALADELEIDPLAI